MLLVWDASAYARWLGHDALADDLTGASGVSCVGCCWAQMLVMFGVGTGSLGWMLLGA